MHIEGIDEIDKKILDIIKDNARLTYSEIGELAGISRVSVKTRMKIMQEKGFKKPILVTSAFHMERSVLNFQKEGIEPIPFPTDFRTNQPRNFHLNKLEPSPSALESSTLFFREKLRSFVTRYIE